jgi:hypothetical protein
MNNEKDEWWNRWMMKIWMLKSMNAEKDEWWNRWMIEKYECWKGCMMKGWIMKSMNDEEEKRMNDEKVRWSKGQMIKRLAFYITPAGKTGQWKTY